jgi:uncharacterized protein with HEPN domain
VKRDSATLVDIARAAHLVQAFVAGSTFAAFRDDRKTQSAVQHQLLVIGEAVKRLSPGFRRRHPDIPWTLIAGMRDQLIHSNDAVDLAEVWNTAINDIPALVRYIEPLLPEPPDETPDSV